MGIYDVNGNPLYSAYDADGDSLSTCYDIDGNVIWSAAPLTLKVMTYNVGGWYIGSGSNVPADKKDAYYALQTGMIENADPDILLIQEYLGTFSADGTSAKTMLESLFPYVHVKTSGTYYGRAVCSKYPITNYTERAYTAESSRYFDSCTITVNDIPITVIDTHLGTTQANRDSEISQLIAYLDTLPLFICGGDFNMNITSESTATEDYIKNVKPFLDAGFNAANCDNLGFLVTYSNEPGGSWTGCLDNIYTSSNVSITAASVDTTKQTDSIVENVDHMPLIATVEI